MGYKTSYRGQYVKINEIWGKCKNCKVNEYMFAGGTETSKVFHVKILLISSDVSLSVMSIGIQITILKQFELEFWSNVRKGNWRWGIWYWVLQVFFERDGY